jgi:hypothetical protein
VPTARASATRGTKAASFLSPSGPKNTALPFMPTCNAANPAPSSLTVDLLVLSGRGSTAMHERKFYLVEPISAQEWGRRQAAASPAWSEEKWQRVATLLGIRWVPSDEALVSDADDDPEAA